MRGEWLAETWHKILTSRQDRDETYLVSSGPDDISDFADCVLIEAAKAMCMFCRSEGLPIYRKNEWFHRGGVAMSGFTLCRSNIIWNMLGNKEPYMEKK